MELEGVKGELEDITISSQRTGTFVLYLPLSTSIYLYLLYYSFYNFSPEKHIIAIAMRPTTMKEMPSP